MTAYENHPLPTDAVTDPISDVDLSNLATSAESVLIDLSRTAIKLLNARDFDNPWFAQNVARDVRVEVQGEVCFGLGGFVGGYETHVLYAKDLQCVVGNVTALVDVKQGHGTTIMSQYLSGYEGQERRMAGTKLISWTWNSRRQRWICQSVTMMYGTPVFLTNDLFGSK